MPINQRQARQEISKLIERYQAMPKPDRQTITEAGVVHQFLDPMLQALGWPVDDPARYKYELHTYGGRPDMTLMPESGGVMYVEAKRFGAIKDLQQARKTMAGTITPGQLALPGMAADRTAEEQQAINYAFANGAVWAVLTNFEKLRLFNARRDWLVLSFEWPGAYLEEFDLLWQLSYECIQAGGLDALSNQRHREDVDTDYLAFINEWRERLAQDIISHPDKNPWAFDDKARVDLAELRAVVQRVLDRLVVVRFAEDHLVAPGGTVYSLYELCQTNPYTFSLSEFFQRLYRRFDELHNSALFAPHLADRAVFSDEVLGGLIRKLYEARYRAMSADIMGNTYEQYLGKTLTQVNGAVVTIDNLETRKKQGSYYTPQVIVRHLVDNSLGRYLYGTADGKPEGEPLEGETGKTATEIRHLHVLDPACGSGSFLIYAYQVLADFYRSEIRRLEAEYEEQTANLARQGMTPMDMRVELAPLVAEMERIRDYPRLILETHLYGVDLDPQAAEIATVNLVMRAMADRSGKQRLPLILNQNVKVGNSLIGAGPDDPFCGDHADDLAELRRLRLVLAAEEHSPEHDAFFARVDETARRLNAGLDARLAGYFEDVGTHRPFNWVVEFPEVFVDEQGQHRGDAAGFDVVVGNPPWEIVKPDLREFYAQFDPDIESRLTRRQVEKRIKELNAEDARREAAWQAQKAHIEEVAAYYRASDDYTRQGRGDTATHKLFLERAYGLLEREGRLGYVIPSGIYSDLGTKELRQMLFGTGSVEYLYGLANVRGFFPDVDSRFRFTLLGVTKGGHTDEFRALFLLSHAEWPLPTKQQDASAILDSVIHDGSRIFSMSAGHVEHFSPNSLSIMEFQSQRDYEIADRIYDERPLLRDSLPNCWNLQFAYEFHMSGNSDLFNQAQIGLPLYEGKMIHQFDPFFAPPRFWIEEASGVKKLQNSKASTWFRGYRFAFREVSNATNERTCIAAVLPPDSFAGHTLWVGVVPDLSAQLYYVSLVNSFCVDWVARLKVSNHVTLFVMQQLPMARLTAGNPYFDAIVPRAAILTCTTPEFADLWQEVMGKPWDESKGATDPVERQRLRDELDALVAHLYGLSRDDFEHILGTFPLVFPDDAGGHARKEALLAVYDRFAGEVKGWPRE